MLRVRPGTAWREDRAVRAALARGGEDAERAAAEIVDALALEVDGVDISAGRTEGTLVGSVEALAEAALRLLAGAPRAHVPFPEGGADLLLRRRGSSALLTLVALERPARVLARDVVVELDELARAAQEASLALGGDLRALGAPAGALAEVAARLGAARPVPVAADAAPGRVAARRPRGRADAPACSFALRDEEGLVESYRGPGADLGSLLADGEVALRGPAGEELAAVAGPPFLALRDLSAFAARLADAAARGERSAALELAAPGRGAVARVEVDLAAAAARRAGGPWIPCPPLALARAVLEAAVDFCGAVAARNPAQAENAWLAELRGAAVERLARVDEVLGGDAPGAPVEGKVRARRARALPRRPLGPGRMRAVRHRAAWSADLGAPVGFGLALAGEGVLVCAGAGGVRGLDAASGAARWSRPPATFAAAAEGLLHLGDAGGLTAVDAASGAERWSAPPSALPPGELRDVVRLGGGLALALGAGVAVALGADGRPAWSFAPPAAHLLFAAGLGSVAVVGSDAGFLYGLDAATGAVRWRLRLPAALAAPPFAAGAACLALCAASWGGAVVGVDPVRGERRFEVPLDVAPHGAWATFAGLVALGASVAGDPLVVAVDPAGRLAWEDAPPIGPGPVGLAALPDGLLLAAAPGGSCAALDRAGAVRWTHARAAGEPGPAAPRPVVARGVALVPGPRTLALDARSGRPLGELPIRAPARLAASAALDAWGMAADGLVTAARLETHLSVL